MTRLDAGGRAAQPGLLCRWHFWRRRCANRKARIEAAAEKVWREHITAVCSADIPGNLPPDRYHSHQAPERTPA